MFQCPDLKSFGLADLGTVCKEGQISFSAVCPQAIAETVTYMETNDKTNNLNSSASYCGSIIHQNFLII